MNRAAFLIITILFAYAVKAENNLEQELRRAIAHVRAKVGIAVITDEGDTVAVNNAVHYPLMSVVKLYQSVHVAHHLREQNLHMDSQVNVSKSDLKPDTYSPLRDQYPEGGMSLSIGQLLLYTLQLSDNNACDLLFRLTGGPKATDAYLRRYWGMEQFAVVVTEEDMHRNPASCYFNYSTPLEAASLMHRLYTFNKEDANLQFIRQALFDCQTGLQRISAGISRQDVQIAHKTGTSDRDALGRWTGINDVAYVQLSEGKGYALAVFIRDSYEAFAENERIIARISAIVFRELGKPE